MLIPTHWTLRLIGPSGLFLIEMTIQKTSLIKFFLLGSLVVSSFSVWSACVTQPAPDNSIVATSAGDVCTNSVNISTSATGLAGFGMSDTPSGVAVNSVTLINSATGAISTTGGGATGIYSGGAGVNILNNGSITTTGSYSSGPTYFSNGIYSDGDNAVVINRGSISVSGIDMYGVSFGNTTGSSFTNSGTILATGSQNPRGFSSIGSLQSFINSGTINAIGLYGYGVTVYDVGNFTNTNTGSITGTEYGVESRGIINTFNNQGTISGNFYGVLNYGEISNFTNNSGIVSVGGDGTAVSNEGSIATFNNSGEISAGVEGTGVFNGGNTITTLSNAERISAGDRGRGIFNLGRIQTLNNSGTISAGNSGIGIYNSSGIINTLTNTGTISAGNSGIGIFNVEGGIQTLNNSGVISAGNFGGGIQNAGTITTLNNTNSISAGFGGQAIINSGTIASLINSGSIFTPGGTGIAIFNAGTIGLLNNLGTISDADNGYGIRNLTGTITTLTNSGTIFSGGAGTINISNIDGTITTLNNAQGGNAASAATTALTYEGSLPTNYNIIINNATHYGQLSASGIGVSSITNFGIYGAPFITSRTYVSVLSGTGGLPTGTRSGTYDNMTWSLVENGVDTFDLTFTGVSLMGTQQSLSSTASALQNTYALQNAVLVNGFTYDCPIFDRNGVCLSTGGRYSTANTNSVNNTSALLIGAYKLSEQIRIGAYLDQNISSNSGSTVSVSNGTPMVGVFGVWSQRPDGIGAEVKLAAGYGTKNTTITRPIVGLSEAGSGSSTLNTSGLQVGAKYGFAVTEKTILSPYVGMRYTQSNMNGYTEGASASVTEPLTYSALNTNATTALAGVGAKYQLTPAVALLASAGMESDLNTNNGTYSATGIVGLTPINFNPSPVKNRATATAGAYYDLDKRQRIAINGIYRQEPFQAVSTTTVLATYTIGL